MARTTEFLFFKKLAMKRLCMDSYYAELFALALTCQCDEEGNMGDTDEKVKVSSNDTNSSYLLNKISEGPGIDLAQINDGGDESLEISHEDTSTVSNIDTVAAQVIDTLIFDTFGHVTGYTLRNLSLEDIFGGGGLVFQDTPTIDFIYSGGVVTADVILSAQEDNDLEILADGLFHTDGSKNRLVRGGVVTWIQDYDFYVSPAFYYIDGLPYESPEAYVTLSPADDTLDRFDVFYLDSDQIVKVIEGDPSLTPSQPGLDLGLEIGLSGVLVEAGTTEPSGALEECTYVDNSEWTTTASDLSIDVDSTNTPCSGSKSIEGFTVTIGDYFKVVRSSATPLIPTFNVLHFLIRSKAAWGTKKLNIQWYNGGVAVGTAIAFGDSTYNFDSSNVADCQLIVINIADFSVPLSTSVDELRFTMSGTGNIGFFIDNLCIQNNGSNVIPADNDIHNQYFGPQTPGDYWISGNGRSDGWFTSPQKIGVSDVFYNGSEKFGWGSQANFTEATAIGFLATVNGTSSGAIAFGSQSVSNGGIAIGAVESGGAGSNVAIGGFIAGGGNTSVGKNTVIVGNSSVALGQDAKVTGGVTGATTIGYFSNVAGVFSTHMGYAGANTFNSSTTVGAFATSTAINQLILGGSDGITHFGVKETYIGTGVTSVITDDVLLTTTGASGTNIAGKIFKISAPPATGAGSPGSLQFQTSDIGSSGSTLQTRTTKAYLETTKGLYLDNIRFQEDEGADVIAANDLTLGTGNTFTIPGNTTINAITNTNWQDGARIRLHLIGTPTLKHNTAGGAGTTKLRLNGAIDFTITGYTVIELELKDDFWNEIGRSDEAGGGLGTLTAANNGTSLSGATVQLGQTVAAVGNPGAMLHHSEIPMATFTLSLNADAAQSANIFQTKNTAAAIRARITSAADFSNTGGQLNSEKFGDGATVAGTDAISIGRLAVSGGNNDVVIGNAANSNTAGGNVLIGNSGIITTASTGVVAIGTGVTVGGTSNATAIGSGAVVLTRGTAIGYSASVTGILGTAIGDLANVSHQASIALGFEATSTAANQFVVGASDPAGDGINDAYFGRGVTCTVANNFKMQPTGASGADMAGNTFTLAGGKATGNAVGGPVYIQTSDAGVSSSTLQTLTNKLEVKTSGELRANKYGVGSFTAGTEVYLIATKADGSLMEFPAGGLPGGGALITANNGLTANTATNVQLGAATSGSANSPLLHNTYINTSTLKLTIYGEAASDAGLNAINFTGGKAFFAQATGGSGVPTIYSQSNNGLAFSGVLTPASQNTVIESLKLSRETTGGGGVGQIGIGTSIGMYLHTSTTAGQLSNEFVSEYTTVTHGSQTSKLTINGVLGGSTVSLLTLAGDGSVKLRPITATEASAITPAEGQIVFVSNTNGTFVSIGIWAYQNGAWKAL